MNAQLKTKPDDTRARIIETADVMFRRLGFAKTAVADIAAELRMSPANVYRFFSSKNAIVEAICQRCLSELDDKAWAVGRSRAPASVRMEKLFLEILNYHRENLITEKRVNDIVLVAMENNWDAIRAHTEVIRTIIELIVRDGIESGEFEAIDPREASSGDQAVDADVLPSADGRRMPAKTITISKRKRANPCGSCCARSQLGDDA